MDVSVTNNATPSSYSSRRIADAAITNLRTGMAGARAVNLPMEVVSDATNLVGYTFSLSNGDYLVAQWSDGAAVEDDPGAKTTLTLPNFAASEVVGIEVLYGFEQQIRVDSEDGDLVVSDLLVKDYPISLRFKNVTKP
jgi:hypothetical protein